MKQKCLVLLVFLAIFLVIGIFSCEIPSDYGIKRVELASEDYGNIYVGIVWVSPKEDEMFYNGVDLAVEEINSRGGFFDKRKFVPVYVEQGENLDEARDTAIKLSKDERIVAVVGYSSSEKALRASVVFNAYGVLFIAPTSTSVLLKQLKYNYVFRTTLSDEAFGLALANYAYKKGFKKVKVVDDMTTYGRGLADIFFEHASRYNIVVSGRDNYMAWMKDFRLMINTFMKESSFDAIFLAGTLPEAGLFMRQCRQMGIKVQFIGGDGMDFSELVDTVGAEATEGTIVAARFDVNSKVPEVVKFIKDFKNRFDKMPNENAAIGYDNIKLLAYGFEKSKSTVPLVVSSTLRFTRNWKGVIGVYNFNVDGEIEDRGIYIKEVRNGKFVVIDKVIPREVEMISDHQSYYYGDKKENK